MYAALVLDETDLKLISREVIGGCESALITDTGNENLTTGRPPKYEGRKGKEISQKSYAQMKRREQKKRKRSSDASPGGNQSISSMSNDSSDAEDEGSMIAAAIEKQTKSTNIMALLSDKSIKSGSKRHKYLLKALADTAGLDLPSDSEED